MSWFHSSGTQSGFTFEGKVSKLLENLNYNIKWPNLEYICLMPQEHLKDPHEIDQWVEFFKGRGQEIPKFAQDEMLVSCKKKLKDKNEVMNEKKILLDSIDCHNANISSNLAGLIVTSSNIPECEPDLGNKIYFWDLRRSFFYAWKSYHVRNKVWKFNSKELSLPAKNSFVFVTEDPSKETENYGECEIFFEQTSPLDQETLEKILTKIRKQIIGKKWMKKGTVYIKTHTLNGFVPQVVSRSEDIQSGVSDTNIKFKLGHFFDYSVVAWEPLTT